MGEWGKEAGGVGGGGWRGELHRVMPIHGHSLAGDGRHLARQHPLPNLLVLGAPPRQEQRAAGAQLVQHAAQGPDVWRRRVGVVGGRGVARRWEEEVYTQPRAQTACGRAGKGGRGGR